MKATYSVRYLIPWFSVPPRKPFCHQEDYWLFLRWKIRVWFLFLPVTWNGSWLIRFLGVELRKTLNK